jgi:hypothetical protein
MSHVSSGFTVTDIEAMRQTVNEHCPELELVKATDYRTWITDQGRLVGDYPLPGLYQLKLMQYLQQQGVDVHQKALQVGVTLPQNLEDLENQPWSLNQQKKLFSDSTFEQGYQLMYQTTIGKDAEYIIRYKPEMKKIKAYEIGLVPHPTRKNEYVMMTDFYAQGNGLLTATGLGKHKQQDGKDIWGGNLKKQYAATAAENAIKKQMAQGNPDFVRYVKTQLPCGGIKLEVFGR